VRERAYLIKPNELVFHWDFEHIDFSFIEPDEQSLGDAFPVQADGL
jgi:hypothetical protein